MLCQNCGKNEATTHIKQVINGDTAERHLCSDCAEHLGYGDAFSGFGFDVAGLFGNFFGDAVHSLGAPRKVVRCPKCGSSFNDIVREGRVGCAECYKVFYNDGQGCDLYIGTKTAIFPLTDFPKAQNERELAANGLLMSYPRTASLKIKTM